MKKRDSLSIRDNKQEWVLENRNSKIVILKDNGSVKNFILKDKSVDLFSGREAEIEIYDSFGKKFYSDTGTQVKSEIRKENKEIHLIIRKKIPGADFLVVQDFRINADHFAWSVELESNKKDNRSVEIRFKLPYPEDLPLSKKDLEKIYKGEASFGWRLWAPHERAPFKMSGRSDEIERIYYRFPYATYANDGIPIPIISLFIPDCDVGFSIAEPLGTPKGDLTFLIDNCKGLTISHANLNLKANPSATIMIKSHEGDWRPGLGWFYKLFPEYFDPPHKEIYDAEGVQLYACAGEREENIKIWAEKLGVRWCELLCLPHFGKFVPDKEPWNYILLAGEEKPDNRLDNLTFKWINSYIDMLNKYGIRTFLYFQMGDCMRKFAKKNFADAIIRNEDGSLRYGFSLFSNEEMNCYHMNPHPDMSWHQYLVDQVKQIIKRFPKIAGIFVDQLSYRFIDYGHDDGHTAIGDRAVCDTDFSNHKTLEKICEVLTEHKKCAFSNGPYNVEIQRYVDGIMSEHRLNFLGKLAYVAIAKPILYLRTGEEALKACLKYGAFPHAAPGERSYNIPGPNYPYPQEKNIFNARELKIYRRYLPLLAYLRGKKWVLTPNPISLPEGIEGNIFETRESDYIVTLLPGRRSVLEKGKSHKNISLKVRVDDASKIKKVYLLSVEYQGQRKLNNWKRKGKEIKINLSLPNVASMLLLSKK